MSISIEADFVTKICCFFFFSSSLVFVLFPLFCIAFSSHRTSLPLFGLLDLWKGQKALEERNFLTTHSEPWCKLSLLYVILKAIFAPMEYQTCPTNSNDEAQSKATAWMDGRKHKEIHTHVGFCFGSQQQQLESYFNSIS